MPNKLLYGSWAQPVEAKTASYTLKERDGGKLFTNRGAGGTITFTLPGLSAASLKGWWVEFAVVAVQAVSISVTGNDKLILHADATADTITMPATIGMHCKVICDGVGFLVISNPTAASAATAVTAVTIAT